MNSGRRSPCCFFLFSMLVLLSLQRQTQAAAIEYYLVLNGDCPKSRLVFAEVQHFLNHHDIDVQVLTPFTDRVDAELLIKNFNLKLNKSTIISSPKKFKKYTQMGYNTYLAVELDGRLIFREAIVELDTGHVPHPIISNPKKSLETSLKNRTIPYFGNSIVQVKNKWMVHNGIYQKVYIQTASAFEPLSLDESILEKLIASTLKGDSLLIKKHHAFVLQNNLDEIRFTGITKTSNGAAVLFEIPFAVQDESTYDPRSFVAFYDEQFKLVAAVPIHHQFEHGPMAFYSAMLFDFGLDDKMQTLWLFITRGHDNSVYSKKDTSLYLLASYTLQDSGFVFNSLYTNKLPSYQVEKEHFYRNLWGKMHVQNSSGGLYGFQYLNEVGFFNGGSIVLEDLKIDKLKLPYEPGGQSNKPFEIIQLRYQNNQIQTVIWQKGYTWLHTYTAKGQLIRRHKLVKSPIKPAAYLEENKVHLLNASLKGKLVMHEFAL